MLYRLTAAVVLCLPLAAAPKIKARVKPDAATSNLITAASTAKGGARTVKMGDNDIETIQTRPRHNTMLVFDGENITFAAGGDTDPHRWVMESPSKTRQTNVFYVKPTRSGGDFESDLNIVTSANHSYSFRLVSCASCAPDLKVFVFHKEKASSVELVDPHLAVIAGLTIRAETAERREKDAISQAEQAKKNAAETVARETTAFQEKYPLSMKSDFEYKRNKPPFLVRAIWTDDAHTFIQLAGEEMTSIYTFVDNKPALTMYKYQRGSDPNVGTYVIEGVLNSGELRLGEKSKLRFDRVKK
jgi:hypothetical protein